MAFAPAQCRDAASGGRMRHHSDCHGRESETVVAIDPTRSTPLPAGPPTPPPEMALLQHAGFPGYVPDYKEDIERLKQHLFGHRRNREPRLMPLQEFAPTRGSPSTAAGVAHHGRLSDTYFLILDKHAGVVKPR